LKRIDNLEARLAVADELCARSAQLVAAPRAAFTLEGLTDDGVWSLCHVPSHESLHSLTDSLVACSNLPSPHESAMSHVERLAVTLMYLRSMPSCWRLGALWNEHPSTVSTYVRMYLGAMATNMAPHWVRMFKPGLEGSLGDELPVHGANDVLLDANAHRGDNGHLWPTVAVIGDMTYCWSWMPSTVEGQKIAQSGYKKRSHFKPLTMVSLDGFFNHISKLYGADNDGADVDAIADFISSEAFRQAVQGTTMRDIIYDRGARGKGAKETVDDAGRTFVEYVVQKELTKVFTPSFGGDKSDKDEPMTMTAADASRLVTMVRWVVEVLNRFLRLNERLSKEFLPHQFDEVHKWLLCAATLHNMFGKPLLRLGDPSPAVDGDDEGAQ
jgi:hypothetical protein